MNINEYVATQDQEVDTPAWIDGPLTGQEIADIQCGGCASGAYMPAVLYADARDTMFDHGDEVVEFIRSVLGDLPVQCDGSWSQYCCNLLSTAVELWATQYEIVDEDEDEDEDEDTED